LSKFFNVRNSLRNLTDEEFEQILPLLAEELSRIPVELHYTPQELYKDWQNLLQVNTTDRFIAPQRRQGLKLCEHFMPNFWDIQSKNGMSFRSLWTNPQNLPKLLRLNRTMHSTPYLSELRRMVYFSYGLAKATMFRPILAKNIISYYKAKTVLDPCAGWGGRMLGAAAAGAYYTAFEPNKETYNNLLQIAKFVNIEDRVFLFNLPAQEMVGMKLPFNTYDLVLTSPPYFSLEVYSNETTQSYAPNMSYSTWVDNFLNPVIFECVKRLDRDHGTSCWNVANVGKYKLIDNVMSIHNDIDYIKDAEFGITSSRRPTGSIGKSMDTTISYKHKNHITETETWFI